MATGVTGQRGVLAPCLVVGVNERGGVSVTLPRPLMEGATVLAKKIRSPTATRRLVLVRSRSQYSTICQKSLNNTVYYSDTLLSLRAKFVLLYLSVKT